MIRLSERMKHIVRLAEPEELQNGVYRCVAEAGCDHAYIIMEIVKRGYAQSGIAMDIRKGPLEIAARNIEREFGTADCGNVLGENGNSGGGSISAKGRICTRLSDGLLELKKGEADLLVMAGMGGGLIKHILCEGREVSDTIGTWILQPQTEYYELRKYLSRIGRIITKEDMVLEDGKFYPMFRVEKETIYGKACQSENELFWEYGPLLLKEKNPCLLEYLKKEESKNLKIYDRLSGENTTKAEMRRKELEQEYERIKLAESFY